jgi:hypothetical protein
MTVRPSFRGSRLALAVALPLPPLAWYGAQQGLGMLVRVRCAAAVLPGGAAGLLALLGCAFALWLSAGPQPANEGSSARTDTVLRTITLLGAGVFGLAIVFQTLAIFIVPSCAR